MGDDVRKLKAMQGGASLATMVRKMSIAGADEGGGTSSREEGAVCEAGSPPSMSIPSLADKWRRAVRRSVFVVLAPSAHRPSSHGAVLAASPCAHSVPLTARTRKRSAAHRPLGSHLDPTWILARPLFPLWRTRTTHRRSAPPAADFRLIRSACARVAAPMYRRSREALALWRRTARQQLKTRQRVPMRRTRRRGRRAAAPRSPRRYSACARRVACGRARRTSRRAARSETWWGGASRSRARLTEGAPRRRGCPPTS